MLTCVGSFQFEQPYIELANCYGRAKVAELEAYVRTNAEEFENVGSFTYLSFKHQAF